MPRRPSAMDVTVDFNTFQPLSTKWVCGVFLGRDEPLRKMPLYVGYIANVGYISHHKNSTF